MIPNNCLPTAQAAKHGQIDKKKQKNISLQHLKDFIFYEYICKMYIYADIKRICRKSRFI